VPFHEKQKDAESFSQPTHPIGQHRKYKRVLWSVSTPNQGNVSFFPPREKQAHQPKNIWQWKAEEGKNHRPRENMEPTASLFSPPLFPTDPTQNLSMHDVSSISFAPNEIKKK